MRKMTPGQTLAAVSAGILISTPVAYGIEEWLIHNPHKRQVWQTVTGLVGIGGWALYFAAHAVR